MGSLNRSHLQMSSLTLIVPSYFAYVAHFYLYSMLLFGTVVTSQLWHGYGIFSRFDTFIANSTGAYQIILFFTHGFYAPTAIAISYSIFIFLFYQIPIFCFTCNNSYCICDWCYNVCCQSIVNQFGLNNNRIAI